MQPHPIEPERPNVTLTRALEFLRLATTAALSFHRALHHADAEQRIELAGEFSDRPRLDDVDALLRVAGLRQHPRIVREFERLKNAEATTTALLHRLRH